LLKALTTVDCIEAFRILSPTNPELKTKSVRKMKQKKRTQILRLLPLVLAMFSIVVVVSAAYYEDDIQGMVTLVDHDTWEIGSPWNVRVNIDTCSYDVNVVIVIDGDTEYDEILEGGEDSGWISCYGEETTVYIQHPGGNPMAITYTGTIEYNQSK